MLSENTIDDQHDVLAGQRVAPKPTNMSEPFWDAAAEGTFLIQVCRKTGVPQFYPRPVSVQTGTREVDWTKASGRGSVYSHTVTRRAAPPYKTDQPYIVATIELEEGVRVMANIVDCAPEDVAIDMPVELTWVKAQDMTFPAFRPSR